MIGPAGTTVVAVVEPTICEVTRGEGMLGMVVGTTVVGGVDTGEEGGRTVWDVTVDWDGGSVLVGWAIVSRCHSLLASCLPSVEQ